VMSWWWLPETALFNTGHPGVKVFCCAVSGPY
jgi:hypothetical protein